MKAFRLWASLILVLVVVAGGLFAWWNYDLRWRPHTIKKHQAEIAKLLDGAGWVSPGQTGPKLYIISHRDCAACDALKTEALPKLQEAGVDTRVIAIAPADLNGVAKSTPAERAVVAELWLNRSWRLMPTWDATPASAWKAPGIAPADGDLARTAVVEAGRKLVSDLKPLLRANGIQAAYPTLIWWTKDSEMRGCACERPKTYRYISRELGATP